jgi:hypothetical protein
MDDFSIYGNNFEEELETIEIFFIRCQETNLSLSNEKFHMLLTKGIFLGHCISFARIKVDLAKIEVISKLLVPKTKNDVKSFLVHASYYK